MSAAEPPFSTYQYEIYAAGLSGQRPSLPASGAEWERRFGERVAPEAYDYIAGGAGSEDTMRANLEAFRRRRIVPRMLRNVDERDLRVRLFDFELPAPVLIAPIGVQGIVHDEGELATAPAASVSVPMVGSTAATRSIEEVPDYLTAELGERPSSPCERGMWDRAAVRIGHYRSSFGITDPTAALGDRPRELRARGAHDQARRDIDAAKAHPAHTHQHTVATAGRAIPPPSGPGLGR